MQSVDILQDGVYVETKESLCPVHPSASVLEGPYGMRDKNMRCADGSVICWHRDYVLQSFKDGSSCFWINPWYVLKAAIEGGTFCVDGPDLASGMYVRMNSDGILHARCQGRAYSWSAACIAEPVEGTELTSWWHRCSDNCWYNKAQCFTSEDPTERCPCSYGEMYDSVSLDVLVQESIEHSKEAMEEKLREHCEFVQKELEEFEKEELVYSAKQAEEDWAELEKALCSTLDTTEHDEDTVDCQGCGSTMPKDDQHQYRVGYWCSRDCAYDR